MSLRRDPKLRLTYLPCLCGCGRLLHRHGKFDGLHGPDFQIEFRLIADAEANSKPRGGLLGLVLRDRRLHPTFLPCFCGCGRLLHRNDGFDGLHGPDHEVERRLVAARKAAA